jgi:hypothetical protein
MTIETTDRRRHVLTTGKKKEIADAIYEAQAALRFQLPPVFSSTADELTKLARLRDQGVLSKDEFEFQKMRLIGRHQPPHPATAPAIPVVAPRSKPPIHAPRISAYD